MSTLFDPLYGRAPGWLHVFRCSVLQQTEHRREHLWQTRAQCLDVVAITHVHCKYPTDDITTKYFSRKCTQQLFIFHVIVLDHPLGPPTGIQLCLAPTYIFSVIDLEMFSSGLSRLETVMAQSLNIFICCGMTKVVFACSLATAKSIG